MKKINFNKKIDQVIKCIESRKEKNLDRALEILESLEQENITGITKEKLFRFLLTVGKFAYYTDYLEEALKLLKMALDLTIIEEEKATALFFIGRCYHEQDKYIDAIENLKKALNSAHDSEKLIVKIMSELGQTYIHSNNFKEAVECFKNVTDNINRKWGSEAKIYFDSALSSLATCYWKLGDEEMANKYAYQVLSMKDVPKWILQNTHCILGHRFLEKNIYLEAKEHYTAALKYSTEKSDRSFYKNLIKECKKNL